MIRFVLISRVCIVQDNNAAVEFGPQGDANLYRSTYETLQTDANLVVSGNLTLGSSRVNVLDTITRLANNLMIAQSKIATLSV